jgi:hypothetical protein
MDETTKLNLVGESILNSPRCDGRVLCDEGILSENTSHMFKNNDIYWNEWKRFGG